MSEIEFVDVESFADLDESELMLAVGFLAAYDRMGEAQYRAEEEFLAWLEEQNDE